MMTDEETNALGGTIMDLNRHHYFAIGIVLFLLGLQFRYVSSFELNERSTRIVEKRLGSSAATQSQPFGPLFAAAHSPRRTVQPPRWLGWCLMSVGGVLFIYSLSMRRPGA